MKFCLIFPLIFTPFFSHAQFADFPAPGMEYGSVYVCNPFDCPNYLNSSMRYTGDTTLCGEKWHKFRWLPYLNSLSYIRMDQGKYYVLLDCAQQELVYDFSKGIGDTVLTYDLGALKVINVGVFTLDNGGVRKKMTLQSLDSLFPLTYTWVDGIGDIDMSFFRYSDFEGGHEQLICLRDSSGVFYHSQTWNLDCDSLLCPVPRPGFDFNCTDKTFQFTNLSRESDTYLWEFGDGEISTEKNPVHTFSEPGCYSVTLKATSDCLPLSYQITRRITVSAPVFWKKSAYQPPVHFIRMQFLDAQNGWASGSNDIWKTTDGGIHWDSIPYPGPARPVINLQFSDFEHGVVQVKKTGSVYDEILWTNDGVNWSVQMPGNDPNITAIERLSDSVAVVAAHYEGIYTTKNGGQTWTQFTNLGGISLITDFVPIGGDTVYFSGMNQLGPPFSEFGFGKSFDALNWQVISQPGINYPEKMSFTDGQTGWLSNGIAVYHTQNGGETWNLQTYTPAHTFNLEFADPLHGWACGHATGIYGTDDGGQTWTQQACIRAEENIGALAAISANLAYVFTKDGLFKFSATPDTVSICQTSKADDLAPGSETLFSIYPNPVSDHFWIKWLQSPPPSLELAMFNAQGDEVKRWRVVEGPPVSVSNLPSGFYYVQSAAEGKIAGRSKKLIILK